MGVHEYYANMAANCRRGHWYCANLTTVKKAMTKERLINSGFYDLATAYQSVHVNYWKRRIPNGTYGAVRGRRLVTASYSIYRFDFIIGGKKDGMLEMANGHFFRGIRKINSRCKIIDNIRQQIEFNSKSLSDKDIQLMTLSLNSSWYKQVLTHCLLLFVTSTGELLDSVKIYVNFPPKYYWRKKNHTVFYFWKKWKLF